MSLKPWYSSLLPRLQGKIGDEPERFRKKLAQGTIRLTVTMDCKGYPTKSGHITLVPGEVSTLIWRPTRGPVPDTTKNPMDIDSLGSKKSLKYQYNRTHYWRFLKKLTFSPRLHGSRNVCPQGSLTMFNLHLILSLPQRQRASHNIQQGSMVINHNVALTVYCETSDVLSSTKLQKFNKQVREYAKINISNKSSNDLNTFVCDYNRSKIFHSQVCQAQFTST